MSNSGVSSSRVDIRGGVDGSSTSSIYLYNPSGQLSTSIGDGTYNTYFNVYGGNFGIGTANPTANLEIWGASPAVKITQNPGLPGNPSLSIQPAGTNNSATIYLGSAAIQANTSTGSSLALNPTGGNVGIGTANATANLEVWGVNPAVKITQNPGLPGSPSLSIQPAGTNNPATIYLGAAVIQASTSTGLSLALNPTGGNVGIGTTTPQYKLAVNGTIGTKEVVVTNTGWADYVFKPGFRLRPLKEIDAYIKLHQHLPEIPSEKEVQESGVGLGEMQVKLLAKIEELTLHMIQADERNSRLEQQNRELQIQNRDMQTRISRIENSGIKAR